MSTTIWAARSPRKKVHKAFITGMLLIGEFCTASLAGVYERSGGNEGPRVSGPYCGIYCLYTALRLQGVSVPLESLVKYSYLQGAHGSTLTDLVEAAHDAGCYAVVLTGVTTGFLNALDKPAILHVKRDLYLSQEYDHYVLLVGSRGGMARVLDFPNPPQTIALSDIEPRWDHAAVLASPSPELLQDVANANRRNRLRMVAVFVPVVLVAFAAKRYLRLDEHIFNGRRWLLASSIHCVLLLGAGIAGGLVYNSIAGHGLFVHADATNSITEVHFPTEFGTCDRASMESHITANDAVIVDARRPDDYTRGHIQDAINIPADYEARARVVAFAGSIPKERLVIIYCQSSGCAYASHVARQLALLGGHTNVRIYRGGWQEWASKDPSSH